MQLWFAFVVSSGLLLEFPFKPNKIILNNADAYDSVYIMHVEKVEDVTFDDLDLGR